MDVREDIENEVTELNPQRGVAVFQTCEGGKRRAFQKEELSPTKAGHYGTRTIFVGNCNYFGIA